jgi:hypothetical protein
MTKPVRSICTVLAVVAAAGWCLALPTKAADEKDVRGAVLRLATAIEKHQTQEAGKQADALAKGIEELADVMLLMSIPPPRGPGIPIERPFNATGWTGIEALLGDLAKRSKDQPVLKQRAGELRRVAFITAAIAEVARRKLPDKDQQEWKAWAEGMRKGALELAAAVKEQNPEAVQAAARRLENNCNSCHEKFR